jgi:hypothetical protein
LSAGFFLVGGMALMDEELAATGAVAGKRVLHLVSVGLRACPIGIGCSDS